MLRLIREGEYEKPSTRISQEAALAGLEEFEEAERLLQSAHERIEKAHTKVAERIRLKTKKTTEQHLVELYDKWGKPEEAARWRKMLESDEGE